MSSLKEILDVFGGVRNLTVGAALIVVLAFGTFAVTSFFIIGINAQFVAIAAKDNRQDDDYKALVQEVRALASAQQKDDIFHASGKRYTEARGIAHEKDYREHVRQRWHPNAGEEFARLKSDIEYLKRRLP